VSPASLAEKVTEQDPIRRWRLPRPTRAGCPLTDALVLSGRCRIDLRAAARLVQAGCPIETAMRIVL
jgi:hypothetical protein